MNTKKVMSKITLNMIVKDEAPVIERCLSSVMPYIDDAVIVDTGSTDDTVERISRFFETHGKPVTLYERPWVDFAHNRNEALRLAEQGDSDYVLFIDADEVLASASPGKPLGLLTADGYMLNVEYGGWSYRRNALVNAKLPWKWVGVLHEYLTCDEPHKWATLDNPKIVVSHDGARARDPETYKKDIAVLEKAVLDEPNNARYWFYLAQSYKDAGDYNNAESAYWHRSQMAEYPEEQWFAMYQWAAMCERTRTTRDPVHAAYLDAYRMRPWRAEPLYALARYCRLAGDYEMAAMYATTAAKVPYPRNDRLFIDRSIYEWRCLDELGIAGFYSKAPGSRAAGLAAAKAALKAGPIGERDRLAQNVSFYAKPRTK